MTLNKEPRGLGAVARDTHGTLWLSNRFDADIEWELAWWSSDLDEWRNWSDIDGPQVLNFGYLVTTQVSA